MIKFRTAAIYCSIFVILDPVISGAGASRTLGKLGAVNAIPGAFVVAFATAISVYLMTVARFPVSTWILCPLLAGVFSMSLYLLIGVVFRHMNIHMFKLDRLTRWSLLGAGIFGFYSLGATISPMLWGSLCR